MKTIFITFLLSLSGTFMASENQKELTLGLFADCQYSDYETKGIRFYKKSLSKLNDCITEFNTNKKIDFIVSLGDIIDKDFSSFDKINETLYQSIKPVYHVLGNHDFSVEEDKKSAITSKLKMGKNYYTLEKNNWRFIFLDGNEVSLFSGDSNILPKAEKILANLKKQKKPNACNYNGGIGKKQLIWLEEQINQASKKNQLVTIFCHYPIFPLEGHCLWNSEDVLELISGHNCVKAWINGHNHKGNYTFHNNIHFLNLKGMIDTETKNSFATASFKKKKIIIKGFGREESRVLKF
jgi:predicted phosphodiesterase